MNDDIVFELVNDVLKYFFECVDFIFYECFGVFLDLRCFFVLDFLK